MYDWLVMPLCERQLRDVNPSDVLNNGLYRRCNIYKGGGGYDKFEAIYQKRNGVDTKLNEQFVVQLRGCPLRCPYCYVTEDGISKGEPVRVPTHKLVDDFKATGYPVFHLMGGAPALYIEHWPELLENLPDYAVFHSDLLLQEGTYTRETCSRLAKHKKSLYAVSIKGCDQEEFRRNTGVGLNEPMFRRNLDILVDEGVPFYLTYTGMSAESIKKFEDWAVARYGSAILRDAFGIELVHYKALD